MLPHHGLSRWFPHSANYYLRMPPRVALKFGLGFFEEPLLVHDIESYQTSASSTAAQRSGLTGGNRAKTRGKIHEPGFCHARRTDLVESYIR